MKAVISLLILVVLIWGCAEIPPVRAVDNVFFAIGREDKSALEFAGFRAGIAEYRCTVGVDCLIEEFPGRLHRAAPNTPYRGIERIIISFRLDQAYNNVILRLARDGGETTEVTVDRKQTYLVTSTMLGSADHGEAVGVYNLELGTLKKGVHTIQLSIADDGKGGDGYQWDALSLFSK